MRVCPVWKPGRQEVLPGHLVCLLIGSLLGCQAPSRDLGQGPRLIMNIDEEQRGLFQMRFLRIAVMTNQPVTRVVMDEPTDHRMVD